MHLRLRLASNQNLEPELERVLAFYGQNAHKYVREREPEVLKTAIGRSSLMLLEDEQSSLKGVCAQITHGHGLYSETGAVRILVNGLGLQSIMMGICALNEYIFSPPDNYIFAITAEDNVASLKNIVRAGFVSHTPDDSLTTAIGYEGGFPLEKRLFRFELAKAHEIRGKLLNIASSRSIGRGASVTQITVDHPLFRGASLEMLKNL
jgi:hypothetical protein